MKNLIKSEPVMTLTVALVVVLLVLTEVFEVDIELITQAFITATTLIAGLAARSQVSPAYKVEAAAMQAYTDVRISSGAYDEYRLDDGTLDVEAAIRDEEGDA